MNLKSRIPTLATLPLLLLACEEVGGDEASGADTGSDAAGDAGTDTVTQDTTPAEDTAVEDTAVEDTTPVDHFVMPTTLTDMTTVDCTSATGTDAFFCAAVAYCGWADECMPSEFAAFYDSVASCEEEVVLGYVTNFGGQDGPLACQDALEAWNDCAYAACDVGIHACDAEFDIRAAACALFTTETKLARRTRRR